MTTNKKSPPAGWALGGAEVREELVAVASGDGDLMAAFGAAAVEDGCAGLGLHAREETVGLRAVAAVGLKGTLGHDTYS